MINGYSEILKSLYERYYGSSKKSSAVTSSYWKTIGRQDVRWAESGLTLQGFAFGSYKKATLFNTVQSLPQHLLVDRLVNSFDVNPLLLQLGKSVAKTSERLFNFDCAKQVLALNHILQKIERLGYSDGSEPSMVCVIGDGYGYMTALLKKTFPTRAIVCINLGRTLLFDAYYSRKSLPDILPILLEGTSDESKPWTGTEGLLFIEAENYDLLERMPVSLFINMASMQEMNMHVIQRYFDLMRSSPVKEKYFYCCNREEKLLPDGEIVRFDRYPWMSVDTILTDELCPWNQHYPSSVPPFWRAFDGPVRHRLVRLHEKTSSGLISYFTNV